MYDIEWINDTKPTVDDCPQFEMLYADALRDCDKDDIGGLIVYLRAGNVVAVFDYENGSAWFA